MMKNVIQKLTEYKCRFQLLGFEFKRKPSAVSDHTVLLRLVIIVPDAYELVKPHKKIKNSYLNNQ